MTVTERLELVHEDLERLYNEITESRKANKTKKQYQDDLRYFASQLENFADELYTVIEDPEDGEQPDKEKIASLVQFVKEQVNYDARASFAWRTDIYEVVE